MSYAPSSTGLFLQKVEALEQDPERARTIDRLNGYLTFLDSKANALLCANGIFLAIAIALFGFSVTNPSFFNITHSWRFFALLDILMIATSSCLCLLVIPLRLAFRGEESALADTVCNRQHYYGTARVITIAGLITLAVLAIVLFDNPKLQG
jgi:hypothetical protein